MQVLRKGHVMRMRRNVYAVPMFRQIERLRRNQQADIHLVIVRKFMPMNHAVPVAAETVRVTVKAVPVTHAVAVRAGAGRAARAVVACIPRPCRRKRRQKCAGVCC